LAAPVFHHGSPSASAAAFLPVPRRIRCEDGRFRPHPCHPWPDPAALSDPGHIPARHGVAVDGKERRLARAGGGRKVHLLAAVTHLPGLVIAQDRVAKSGKANEVTRFRPLLAPLPLDGVLVTSDAMQTTRDNALFLRKAKSAHYLFPVLGNQPNLNAQLTALPWETTPVAAATGETSRGRIETRTIRVLPAPEGTGFQDARQAVLIERYTTFRKNGRWRARPLATRRDLERRQITHQNRKRTQVWSALANLVITLFRIHGVTSYTAETRRCAQDPRRALGILSLPGFSPA
jgi:hypothetical protein